MTEEIIIDGVDVAGCFYFIDHTPPKGQGDWCGAIHKGACKVYSKDCEYNKNCYYKQLKRLEQENKHLNDLLNQALKEQEELRVALEEIRKFAGQRFVSGLNEEADAYNNDMNEIENKINEVLKTDETMS